MSLKYQLLSQGTTPDGEIIKYQVWDTVTQYRKEFVVSGKLATIDAESALKELVQQDLGKNPIKDLN